jgi:ribose transport system substrate-binding protein
LTNRYLQRMSPTFTLKALVVAVSLLMVLSACGQAATTTTDVTTASADPAVVLAKAFVARATAPVTTWDGPTTGPKAQPGKFIVYVSSNQQNGGVLGVSKGIAEAAAAIGWRFQIIDGMGTVAGQTDAINQAIALKPDGIILGGLDATSQQAALQKATALGIKVVGWHAGSAPGPIPDEGVFMNISSDPEATAKLAADYAIAQSNGTAQAVILTDSEYAIAVTKSQGMRSEIEQCQSCKLLSYEDTPLAAVSTRMPPLMTSLLKRYGSNLWMLGINDLYFDYTASTLQKAGIGQDQSPQFISAGDGSVSAYDRIRSGQHQVATIPEPLNQQGWQIVDELNRALAGGQPSGYVMDVHLVTKANIGVDGGPQNVFDPGNGYRKQYQRLWGIA